MNTQNTHNAMKEIEDNSIEREKIKDINHSVSENENNSTFFF